MIGAVASTPLVALHALAASIWVGGLVVIFVVARSASVTLDPAQRIALFRAVGRSYGIVGSVALLVALASGALLLRGHPWNATLIAATIVAAALLVVLAVGMAQARAMTRLRRRALAEPDGDLDSQVRKGAALATVLRAAIGALTLLLVVLGSALAS